MKNCKTAFLFSLIFLGLVANVFATAQYPDKIIYKGKDYALHTNPMGAYFEKYPDKKPKGGLVSSALWRGYVATFEITNNEMFLKDIEIQVQKKDSESFDIEWKSVLSEVVAGDKKLKIDWFSGLLVLPHGKLVNYVHMGYGSTYEKYILLEVAAGDLKKEKKFGWKEYEKFKEQQFEAFKKTDDYKKLIEEEKKRDKNFDAEFFDSFLRSFVTDYTSKILTDQ